MLSLARHGNDFHCPWAPLAEVSREGDSTGHPNNPSVLQRGDRVTAFIGIHCLSIEFKASISTNLSLLRCHQSH